MTDNTNPVIVLSFSGDRSVLFHVFPYKSELYEETFNSIYQPDEESDATASFVIQDFSKLFLILDSIRDKNEKSFVIRKDITDVYLRFTCRSDLVSSDICLSYSKYPHEGKQNLLTAETHLRHEKSVSKIIEAVHLAKKYLDDALTSEEETREN